MRGLGERQGKVSSVIAGVGTVLWGGRDGGGVGAGEGARRGVGCATTCSGELVNAAAAGPWDAVRGQEVPELTVLFGEGIFTTGNTREVLLQAENFLLERFDVEFFSLAVGSRVC